MTSAEHVVLSFEWRDLKLVGSLHLPSRPGPHPAVLMAQGSGPADRDSGGYFVPIRTMFNEQGIATFAFDKPGCGESSGAWQHYALNDRVAQVIAALEVVRGHPAIAQGRVGMWGHSQGGWMVQKLAGDRRAEPAFAIASSGPTIDVREQTLYDCEQTIRKSGHGDQATTDAVAHTRALFEAADNGVDFASISSRLLEPASHLSWYDGYPTIEDSSDWQHFTLLIGEPHDPVSDLRGVTCPFLAVYGGRDSLLPAWRCVEESGRALAAAASTDVTVVVFPDGDHRIQQPESTEFVSGYLDLVGDWTAHRVR